MSEPTAGAERVHTVVDSPYGPLTLVAEGEHLVGLYMQGQRHRPGDCEFGDRLPEPDQEPFAQTVQQLREYFAGQRQTFDLPLKFHGTPFQQRVWTALRQIPFGQTWSYRELADYIGSPAACRAVGLANGKNPIGIVVPCHRVVGSDGSLTGYGGGLDRKQALLAHERTSACP